MALSTDFRILRWATTTNFRPWSPMAWRVNQNNRARQEANYLVIHLAALLISVIHNIWLNTRKRSLTDLPQKWTRMFGHTLVWGKRKLQLQLLCCSSFWLSHCFSSTKNMNRTSKLQNSLSLVTMEHSTLFFPAHHTPCSKTVMTSCTFPSKDTLSSFVKTGLPIRL